MVVNRQPVVTRVALWANVAAELLGAALVLGALAPSPLTTQQRDDFVTQFQPAAAKVSMAQARLSAASMASAAMMVGLGSLAGILMGRRGGGPESGAAPLVGATAYHVMVVYVHLTYGGGAGLPQDVHDTLLNLHVGLGLLSLVGLLTAHWFRWGGVLPDKRDKTNKQAMAARIALLATMALEGPTAFTHFLRPAGEALATAMVAPGLSMGSPAFVFYNAQVGTMAATAFFMAAGAIAAGATGGNNASAYPSLLAITAFHAVFAVALFALAGAAGATRENILLAGGAHTASAVLCLWGLLKVRDHLPGARKSRTD